VVAGAVRLPLWQLVVGTAIGLLPGTLATTIFGDQIETAVSGGSMNWWIIGGCAAVLGIGIYAVKRWFSKMAGRMDGPDGLMDRPDGRGRGGPKPQPR
jgi:uncharacterized membrane protein YdjX (TVP38/TMEM64 family)